ncbi:acyltransferase [Aminobacter anthyllidis]|uniref:Acyltransferase n=1 Tax=Aminobacter anthyllidis TaxID=1035067 RepID=A0A9X1D6H3_9HYPH|nr:acyltransferase family protein [Aminobacter anthyllidis]MBT1157036.1 acyltransferase [Aminobacter anthyllidis]
MLANQVLMRYLASMQGALMFRPDIQGLRAIAVVAVLLFHAGVSTFPGGFLGVDAFFVISGYLITRNIHRDVNTGEFSFLDFYRRRLVRLAPAAFVTILLSLFAAYLLQSPDQVIALSQSAIAAAFGLSNFVFWSQVGYFDLAVYQKPLLHTWSLGVEEQFYLIWPAVLVLGLRRKGLKFVVWLLVGVSLLSLAGAQLLLNIAPSAVFYLMPFRLFEFGLGACLALSPWTPSLGRIAGTVLQGIGLALIGYSLCVMTTETPMPGVLSLIPCVGTALVILAGRSNPTFVLTNPLMQFVGKVSYPLYLVHWPLVVFFPNVLTNTLGYVALCLALAALVHWLVEVPAKRHFTSGRRLAFPLSMVSAASVSLVAFHAIATEGWRFRLPPELQKIQTARDMWLERNPVVRVGECFLVEAASFDEFNQATCLALANDRPNVLIVGDSMAADLFSALGTAFPGVNFLEATSGNCTPVLETKKGGNCKELLDFVFLKFIDDVRLDAVVLNASWGFNEQHTLGKTVQHLRARVGKVIVAGPPVRFRDGVPNLIYESGLISVQKIEAYVLERRHPGDQVNPFLGEWANDAGASYLDIHATMCGSKCRIFDSEGKLIFLDFGHLTLAGSKYLAGIISSQWAETFTFVQPAKEGLELKASQ